MGLRIEGIVILLAADVILDLFRRVLIVSAPLAIVVSIRRKRTPLTLAAE